MNSNGMYGLCMVYVWIYFQTSNENTSNRIARFHIWLFAMSNGIYGLFLVYLWGITGLYMVYNWSFLVGCLLVHFSPKPLKDWLVIFA